ncbi:ABC transporter ATP-binding protein [Paenibacillus chitinolyticus]|uniref:ABC transporter ATP-binding protein n=1 Tax=Paenibacillus chitinolyticus TaxID=79263 RepID=A0A410WVG3_9BACL|nr:ABC transporter ATP-binding protein [Paenibacillus chitinolyticus]MCY9589278.1 ABC transporter ATP-binding protein/permease [Paenibacillus chitinolyticus]MCY9594351.1 ABC transporter ATP-binding protein/permease [Paenibacillus chitinolyticus]QAV18398.1 ABC transporter ATP-binding protein [Paenibacillus chitinolyticus]
MEVFKGLKRFYWPERKLLFASIFCLICTTALGLVYPNLLRYLIDDVIAVKRYDQVPLLALFVVGVIAVKALFQFLHGFSGGRLGNRVAYNMREAMYEKLQYLSFQYYDKARTGDLMSRLTADLEAIRNFIGFGFAQILNVFLMVIFGMVMMFSISWKLTLLTMLTMPFLAFAAIRFEGKIHPAFRSLRASMSNMTTAVQENITGVRTVKSFAREPYEVEKFTLRNEEYRANNVITSEIWSKYFPVMELIANLSAVILLGVGGYMVILGSLSVGELVAFFSLVWYIIGPMWGIGFHINNYTQSKASGEKILEILHQYVHVKDGEHAVELNPATVKGHVCFERVTFAYPDAEAAIHDLSLNAPPGTVIGFLGGTGSGKSTIISLLMRAYNVKTGQITLDGMDIKDIRLESLRSQIATVFQETFLFSSTIKGNIAYGRKDVTMDEIIRAAKLVKAHDFIMEMPLGYDTVVGERGMGLSGGQKQRIAIARALIKDPKILILDDATSAVDMETEQEIQAGFKEVMRGRTTFIIAHRISSLKHADEIIVLDKGRVVQRGTHSELIRREGPYLETYRIQYSDHPDVAGAADAQQRRAAVHE